MMKKSTKQTNIMLTAWTNDKADLLPKFTNESKLLKTVESGDVSAITAYRFHGPHGKRKTFCFGVCFQCSQTKVTITLVLLAQVELSSGLYVYSFSSTVSMTLPTEHLHVRTHHIILHVQTHLQALYRKLSYASMLHLTISSGSTFDNSQPTHTRLINLAQGHSLITTPERLFFRDSSDLKREPV